VFDTQAAPTPEERTARSRAVLHYWTQLAKTGDRVLPRGNNATGAEATDNE